MKTTLDLEDDVLSAVEELAQQQGLPVGKVLSDLARQALAQRQPLATRNGLPLFPIQPDAGISTLELVNQLRDEAL
jgi:hypothetical protein